MKRLKTPNTARLTRSEQVRQGTVLCLMQGNKTENRPLSYKEVDAEYSKVDKK